VEGIPLLAEEGWRDRAGVVVRRNVAPVWPPRLRRFDRFATFFWWRRHPSSARRGIFSAISQAYRSRCRRTANQAIAPQARM